MRVVFSKNKFHFLDFTKNISLLIFIIFQFLEIMNIDYKIKKEYFKMQVQNEKELIQIPIDMFYEDFTVYESNERVAFKNFSENKKRGYTIE